MLVSHMSVNGLFVAMLVLNTLPFPVYVFYIHGTLKCMKSCFLCLVCLRLNAFFLFLYSIFLFRLWSFSWAHYLSPLMIRHGIPCSDNMKQH